MTPVLVVLGAAAGAPLRLLASRMAARRAGGSAWGTLAVNVVGSALLGVLLGSADPSPTVLALVGTGFCGTLTTFSTFGADVVQLIDDRTFARALAYASATLVLGLGAAAAGCLLTSG